MNSFNLEIITPIKSMVLKEVSYLRCPGLDGAFGLMPKHQEGIFALKVGEIKVTVNGKEDFYSTGGGFAEILDNNIKILVESVESSSEIDSERAQNAIDRANNRRTEKNSNHDEIRIENSLMRALNRIKVSRR
jgi:F-type H+-transporting ATPase subunit epsilon